MSAVLSACAPSRCLLPGQVPQQQTTLYFGLARPDGGQVSDAQWRDFVARTVTPRFPDGLTEMPADGQWRDRVSRHIGREPTRMLLLITPSTPDLPQRLQEIRSIYRLRFGQQSVGVVTQEICAGF